MSAMYACQSRSRVLERAADAYAKMMSGEARFRMVLTVA